MGFKERAEPQATEAKPRCDQQLSGCFLLLPSELLWPVGCQQKAMGICPAILLRYFNTQIHLTMHGKTYSKLETIQAPLS